jgi:hypothetical protein
MCMYSISCVLTSFFILSVQFSSWCLRSQAAFDILSSQSATRTHSISSRVPFFRALVFCFVSTSLVWSSRRHFFLHAMPVCRSVYWLSWEVKSQLLLWNVFFWSTILLCCSNFPRLQHVVVICYSLYSRGLFVALRLVARLAKARFPRYCLLDGSCVGREEHYIHQGSLGESPLGRWCCNVFVKLASEPLLQSL